MLKGLIGLCLLLGLSATRAHTAAAQSFQKPVLHRQSMHAQAAASVAYSNAAKNLFASGSEDATIKLYEATGGREIRTLRGHDKQIYQVTFSPDGEFLASASEDGTARVWSVSTGQTIHTFKGHGGPVTSVAFNRSGRLLASGGWVTPNVKLWDAGTGHMLHEFGRRAPDGKLIGFSHDDDVLTVSFSDDGRRLVSGGRDATVKVWDVEGRRQLAVFKGHTSAVKEARPIGGGRAVLSGGADGEFIVWRTADAAELARLVQADADNWLAVAPDGLFDGSPAAWRQLIWRFNNNTLDFAPVESFYNEFFRPGLLKEILDGGHPAAPRDFASLDRRQPKVRVAINVESNAAGSRRPTRSAEISVEVTEAPADTSKGLPAGDVRDVRLFRNGSLVKIWRGRGAAELNRLAGCELSPAADGRKLVCRTTVTMMAGPNRLTAYAFNRDDVKSEDGAATFQGDESLRREGTLYVLAVGIDHYADKTRDLRFAVADIKDIGDALTRQQAAPAQYARTKVIELADQNATKANIMLALRLFAAGAPALPETLPAAARDELSKIEPAQPEDALLIYFSGHGTARCEFGAGGATACDRFYLVPHDGFPTEGLEGEKSFGLLYQNSVSDQELESALAPVDAGKLLLIIDACKSGQALEAEEKRRGPMNSKGLAQLAYEKGMYILAATQSNKFALEVLRLGDKEIRHGLLTYVLLEGLSDPRADADADESLTEREWIKYAADRLPSLQLVKMQGCRDVDVECAAESGEEGIRDLRQRSLQTPRVFYRREADPRPLVIKRPIRGPS